MIQLVRIVDELPHGFDELCGQADAEGHRNLSRLAGEFATAPGMFTALLAAFADGELVGVGGMTAEPNDPSIQRMRRFYVSSPARGQGVGRTLANALLHEALSCTRVVTVHADDIGAARFWEALGFTPVTGQPWSHEFTTV